MSQFHQPRNLPELKPVRDYTEMGIARAVEHAKEHPVQVGRQVGVIDEDTVGLLVAVQSDIALIVYSEEPDAERLERPLCRVFDVQLAYQFALAAQAEDMDLFDCRRN